MPELPEVDSLRKFVDSRIAGLEITRVELAAISALKTFKPPIDALKGRRVAGAERRGKYLAIVTEATGSEATVSEGNVAAPGANDGPLLLVCHLSLGGWMRWYETVTLNKPKLGGKGPMALRLGFSDGSGVDFTEQGTEKRLALWVVGSLDEVGPVQTLGPDPLQTSVTDIAETLMAHKGQIKKVLTDQKIVAGVGNAYSDEALHMAKLSPFRQADKLSAIEAGALAEAVITVFEDAVVNAADVPVSGLKSEKKLGLRVHGRTGQACPVCGDVIREVAFASRSLQYCATCQTGGKPLADRRMSRLLK